MRKADAGLSHLPEARLISQPIPAFHGQLTCATGSSPQYGWPALDGQALAPTRPARLDHVASAFGAHAAAEAVYAHAPPLLGLVSSLGRHPIYLLDRSSLGPERPLNTDRKSRRDRHSGLTRLTYRIIPCTASRVKLHAGWLVNESCFEAEFLMQTKGERVQPDRLGGVVAGIDHVQAVLSRVVVV